MLIVLSLMISTVTFAQSKEDVADMLKQFKEKGMFTDAQLAAAQEQLNKMSDDDLNNIKAKAANKMNDSDIQKKIKELEE